MFRLHECSHRCYISHPLPRRMSSLIRMLGFPMAGNKPRSNGLHLVRRSRLDRRRSKSSPKNYQHLLTQSVRDPNDRQHLALLLQPPQLHPHIRNVHTSIRLLPHLLALFSPSNLVPSPQNPPPFHLQIFCRPHLRHQLLHLGHRAR